MFKNRTLLTIIITIVCGLVAGVISFNQANQNSKKMTLDIISTITPIEQAKNTAISVAVDPMQYNQTLTAVLNIEMNSRSSLTDNQKISCQADLNATTIHCQVLFITEKFNASNFMASFIEKTKAQSQDLITKQYNNKLDSHINLLSYSQPSLPSLPSNPYLLTILGLLAGYFISTIFLKANSD